ncbi:MAG TPA: HlyC/CorC family transporter [Caldilineae bacterium]|nr:HlyC/CorC family transporter [Caldilineae bacterium]
MDVPLGLALGALALSLLLLTLVIMAEVSMATISRAHIRKLGEEGIASAKLIEAFLQDAERFLGGVLVLKTLAISGAVVATVWLVMTYGGGGMLLQAFIALFVALLLLQVVSRVLAIHHPVSVAMWLVRPVRWLVFLVSPLTWILVRVIQRLGGGDESQVRDVFMTEDGLRLLLNLGDEERFIEAEERQMIDSIFRFSETHVEEVMAPRVDVVALEQEDTIRHALDTIVEAGHSRIPIYRDTIDKIVGVLYAKDLLSVFRDGRTDVSIKEVMRKPYFVPESAMVDDLLEDLQHKKVHLAVVVDEYGGTAGVVTIEDLLEEIVGEIQDEYDSESPMLEQIGEGVYVANGRIDIDDLNRDLGVHLPDEEESYTLAGVIYSQLQRVPDVGDVVELDDVRLEVLEVTDNRIEQVQVALQQPSGSESESATTEKER